MFDSAVKQRLERRDELSESQLRHLISVSDGAQRIARLALGASTENVHSDPYAQMTDQELAAELERLGLESVQQSGHLLTYQVFALFLHQFFQSFADIFSPFGVHFGVQNGLEVGRYEGHKPFGSREGEADVLRRMRQLRAERLGCHTIAARLNDEGIPPQSGVRWDPDTCRKILACPKLN